MGGLWRCLNFIIVFPIWITSSILWLFKASRAWKSCGPWMEQAGQMCAQIPSVNAQLRGRDLTGKPLSSHRKLHQSTKNHQKTWKTGVEELTNWPSEFWTWKSLPNSDLWDAVFVASDDRFFFHDLEDVSGCQGQVEVLSPWLARENQICEDRNVCHLVWWVPPWSVGALEHVSIKTTWEKSSQLIFVRVEITSSSDLGWVLFWTWGSGQNLLLLLLGYPNCHRNFGPGFCSNGSHRTKALWNCSSYRSSLHYEIGWLISIQGWWHQLVMTPTFCKVGTTPQQIQTVQRSAIGSFLLGITFRLCRGQGAPSTNNM